MLRSQNNGAKIPTTLYSPPSLALGSFTLTQSSKTADFDPQAYKRYQVLLTPQSLQTEQARKTTERPLEQERSLFSSSPPPCQNSRQMSSPQASRRPKPWAFLNNGTIKANRSFHLSCWENQLIAYDSLRWSFPTCSLTRKAEQRLHSLALSS